MANRPNALALLRVAVVVIVLISPEPEIARLVVARPESLWIRPEGLGWVPFDGVAIAVATFVLRVTALFALVGAGGPIVLGLLAASVFYVFGAAQLTGTVTHDMHLVWFLVLLAVRPPGAAFYARLWLGLVYFFPGIHKLLGGWPSNGALQSQMYFKWYEAGGAPWPRIDRVPWLLDVASITVVAFELAMPLLVSLRRTRVVALAAGVAFHLLAGRFLDVLFPSLIACYAVLLAKDDERPRWSPLAACMTIAIVIQGARGQMQAYPFACYPTFAARAPDEIIDLAVDVDGATYRLPPLRRQDEWGTVWRLSGLYGDPIDRDRLHAFADAIAPKGDRRFMLEAYDVRPGSYGAGPIRRWPLASD